MSVYRVTELIGTSTESWEDAAAAAVKTARAASHRRPIVEVTGDDTGLCAGQWGRSLDLWIDPAAELTRIPIANGAA